MSIVTESTSTERKNECRERIIHNQKVLNCSHRNLPYIPKTQQTTRNCRCCILQHENTFNGLLREFNNLKALFLNDNYIENIKLSQIKHLKNLYLNYNKLRLFPDFSINGSEKDCYFPNLEILAVVSNDIKKIASDNFKCLLKLKAPSLDKNPIKVLPNNLLSKLPNLEILQLRFLLTDNLTLKPFAFKSASLKMLQFEFNRPATALFDSFNDAFRFVPNLETLKLGFISMLLLTNQQLSALFSPLANISMFKCFACQISQDPKVILNSMRIVIEVDLQSNRITTLSDETFKNNKHLKYLSLRYNDIAHIQESALPVSLLNNLHSLDLSQNPCVCDCNLEWLINWMKA
ncbi:carboxypeptidase N subunit 2-like [Mercenaria mercenaria]|uniref:carboxypeptidase N subunit 2-like n=1 Tax=Mercenaria mercenaria TaxID=6596 RepID=UPI00234EFD04|nr:carboxypeptidase N subunit 2-like [Mercenaria mercenaria]